MPIRSPYQFRQSIARWAAMLVMLLLLNMVIDVGNSPMQFSHVKDGKHQITAVNDIETIYEWALESLMEMENAVPESDTPEEDDAWAKKSTDWATQSSMDSHRFVSGCVIHELIIIPSSLITRANDILIPPPRV